MARTRTVAPLAPLPADLVQALRRLKLVTVRAAGRGVAVKNDRARVRVLHEEVDKTRYPLAPGADLLLANELDRDVGASAARCPG
jgi:hypothetical protein